MTNTGHHPIRKALIVFLFATVWRPSAQADAMLPAHLAGSWGTAESLYSGSARQTQMHLAADGFGFMAGSTSPARRADGKDDAVAAPRAVIGFPMRAVWDGTTLQVRPEFPQGVTTGKAAFLVFSCRYQESSAALDCTAPDGTPLLMTWHSVAMAADVEKAISELRQQGTQQQRQP